jgi:hypothetical protein
VCEPMHLLKFPLTWSKRGALREFFFHIKRNVPKAECYNTPVNGHDTEPLGFSSHPHGPFLEDPA